MLRVGLRGHRENWVLMVFDTCEKSAEHRDQREGEERDSNCGDDGPEKKGVPLP